MPRWDDITGEVSGSALRDSSSDRIRPFERDRAYLTVLTGANIGQMFQLANDEHTIGRSHKVNIQLVDEGISRRHATIKPRASDGGRFWLEDLDSRNGTFCNGHRIREHRLYDGDKIQLGRGVMLRFGYQDEFDESFQRTMQESARRDALTACYNKRYFNERIESEFGFAKRHGKPLSLILMDLDHFKRINDNYGHVVGDEVLRRFAQEIQKRIRSEDVLARYGGEEFAIISRSIGLLDACGIAERLRAVIESLTITHHGYDIRVTVSVGVGALPEVEAQTTLDFVDAADRALYEAKNKGRNRVAIFDPSLNERPTKRVELETHPPRDTVLIHFADKQYSPTHLAADAKRLNLVVTNINNHASNQGGNGLALSDSGDARDDSARADSTHGHSALGDSSVASNVVKVRSDGANASGDDASAPDDGSSALDGSDSS